jgi:hypothetical protein
MGHGAIGVMLQRLPETGHRFHVIVAVHPVQAPIEPELGGGRTRGILPHLKLEWTGRRSGGLARTGG